MVYLNLLFQKKKDRGVSEKYREDGISLDLYFWYQKNNFEILGYSGPYDIHIFGSIMKY